MGFDVRRSVACRQDLDRIFGYLSVTYQKLGEDPATAFERATRRLEAIEDAMDALGAAPHQGTLWPEVMDGLRWVTKDRAVLYFIVDDQRRRVDVLAVFFGGEDHGGRVLKRLSAR